MDNSLFMSVTQTYSLPNTRTEYHMSTQMHLSSDCLTMQPFAAPPCKSHQRLQKAAFKRPCEGRSKEGCRDEKIPRRSLSPTPFDDVEENAIPAPIAVLFSKQDESMDISLNVTDASYAPENGFESGQHYCEFDKTTSTSTIRLDDQMELSPMNNSMRSRRLSGGQNDHLPRNSGLHERRRSS